MEFPRVVCAVAEDDAVWQTNNNNNNKVQEEGLSATDNRHQPLSEMFQQPDTIECDTYEQSQSRDGHFDQVRSTLPGNCRQVPETTPETSVSASTTASGDHMDRREVSDITCGTHCLLGSSATDHECTVTSDDVHSVDSESSSLHISSSHAINICRSSREISYCYVCRQPQTQLQYHLKSVHAKEKEVIQLKSASFTAWIQRMVQLRNYGNHRHNQKVLQAG